MLARYAMLAAFLVFSQRAVWGATSSYGIQELMQALEKSGANSVEEALPLLPRSLRSNFTLMHQSMSIQPAEPMNPRAILFGEDGKFIVTFNGADARAGGKALEIIQFNEIDRRFEMYRLDFPLPRKSDGTLKPAEKNPRLCLGCHSADPHPIWASSPTWDGAYGSEVDRIGKNEEGRWFLEFARKFDNDPRYGYLVPPVGSSASPYLPPNGPDPENHILFSPNERLNLILSRLNTRRLAAKIEASPNFEKYRYYVLYAALGCQESADIAHPERKDFVLNDDQRKAVLDFVEKGLPAPEDRMIGPGVTSDLLSSMDLFLSDPSDLSLTIRMHTRKIESAAQLFRDNGYEGFSTLLSWQLLEILSKDEPEFRQYLIPARIRYPFAKPVEIPIFKRIYDLAGAVDMLSRYDACPRVKQRLLESASVKN